MSELQVPDNDDIVFTEDEYEEEEDDDRVQHESRYYESHEVTEGNHDDGSNEVNNGRDEENDNYDYIREEITNGAHEEESSDNEIVEKIVVENKNEAELQLYRALINNIKNTLYQIKSYNKVTLMSDPKASYFTIVDAVLSGPQEINSDDLVDILGVSHNTLARVRRLGERVENEARNAVAQVRSRRASGQTPAGYLSAPEGSRTSRRRSSVTAPTTSRRSSKRSVSAQPLARDEEVDYVDLDARDGVMRHLKDQFHSYSRLGDRRSDGSHISCSQSDKWLKQARIIDGRILTPVDTTILWKKLCKTNIWMNFPTWLKYVEELSITRGLDIHDVREALILCGKPSRPSLPFDKSALTTRLTDTSR